MDAIIETPLALDSLDAQRAVFTGTAEGEVQTLFGDMTAKFPMLVISREHWESLGMPRALHVTAEDRSVNVLD